MNERNETGLVVLSGQKLNKTNHQLAVRQGEASAASYVPHLSVAQVKALADSMGKRDRLLILTIFDGCLRCSEALAATPGDVLDEVGGFALKVPKGKGGKASKVAISASLAAQLRAFAYDNSMSRTDRFWPITRPRAFQIVAEAFDRAGIPRPSRDRDKVGTVHILRHSGAIERLRLTGNPKAVQDQLRHSTALMTLRYMKTLTHDESLKVQEGVNYQW